MLHAISLGLSCFILWLLLSGHYDPLLLGFGVISCLLVVVVARRMDVVDREGHPVHLSLRVLSYWPWLIREIVTANVQVIRCILDPRLIDPQVIRLRPHQRSDLGRVIYANSITLTPGTVALMVEKDIFEVHALTRESATALQEGEMDRRVCRLEGG